MITEEVKKSLTDKAIAIAKCIWTDEQSGKITFTVYGYTIELEQQYHPYSFNNSTSSTTISINISWTDNDRTVIDRSTVEDLKYYNDRPIIMV